MLIAAVADLPLITVISSAAVGVLGGLTGFYGQRVTLHNARAQRRDASRDDLRTVLADAASAAMGWNHALGEPGHRVCDSAAAMDQATTAMQLYRAQLGVRVGPKAPVFIAYRRLQATIQELEDALRGVPETLTYAHLRDPDALDEPLRSAGLAVDRAANAVYAAMDRFYDASAGAVGSSPPAGAARILTRPRRSRSG